MPLTMSMPVAQLLREGTAPAHAKTEKVLAPKLSSIRSYEDYSSILKMFYGFFYPLEKIIRYYVTEDILTDIKERRNSLFIVSDLKAIGHSHEEIQVCKELPEINCSLEALGSLYVLEGSTLGGSMICKLLKKNSLVSFDESNLHFFSGYKENTGSKWMGFLSVIDQYGEDANLIVAAAYQTFTCLTKWMEKSL